MHIFTFTKHRFLLSIILLIISTCLNAKQIEIAVGWTKPPYVIETGNTGFEIELIKGIFASMGHQTTFIYVPFARSHYLLNKGKADVAMTLSKRLDIGDNILSEPYITYHNVAISLKGRGIKITQMSQLGNYSIVAFQNASIVLGSEFKLASKKSPFYIELPDQKKQVEMLLKGRTDLVVMDINIFNYLSKAYIGSSHMESISVHRVFPSNPYHLGFKNSELSKNFNKSLQEFRQSTQYIDLINKYEFIQ